jgi:hypothetical protein
MRNILVLSMLLLTSALSAQTQVGDKWVDNNLTLKVAYDKIKTQGVFAFCVYQSAEEKCVENLTTGVEIEVQDAQGKVLWKGTAKGHKKSLKLPAAYPNATYLVLRAFKPWVVNKNTGTRIHQEKALEIKYSIKG